MTEGLLVLAAIVFAVFLLDWLAVAFAWRRVEFVLKPLAMVLVIVWTLIAAEWRFDALLGVLVLAQLCGLAGDVFLMLHARWFLAGLGSFLVGHLLYIGLLGWKLTRVFNRQGYTSWGTGWLLLAMAFWAMMLVLFYRIIAPKSPRLSMPLFLWIPIQVYGWVLSVLVVLSILVVIAAEVLTAPILALLAGSLFFFVSDSLLAYDRFKRKLPKIRVWIMFTYHLAQFSLALGFLTVMGHIGG